MKRFIPLSAIVFGLIFSFSAHTAQAQSITNDKNAEGVTAANITTSATSESVPNLGKEIPVPGGVLFVTPAERASMEKEKACKIRKSKKQKREDRKEVTRVIGNSVNNYLANVYNVHTLQRF